MPVSVSVVIPTHDASSLVRRCIEAVLSGSIRPLEIIVVDDQSQDDTQAMLSGFPVKVLRTDIRRGPAYARNEGAKAARGDVVLFLDADVCVKSGTVEKICQAFDSDGILDALIGSYDSTPDCKDFISQYRNLMHAYVHQTSAQQASTFWSGCGAIRRSVFLEHSGFSEGYGRPAIEDIELGYRLIQAGRKIVLDRSIEVTHLKRWTFWSLVRTDILDRGIPWTELIMRDRFMPNDLNLQLSQRVSVALVFILVALSGIMAALSGGYLLIPLFAIIFLMLARWWVEIGNTRRPRSAYAMLICVVGLITWFAYSHGMFGLIPPLIVSPVLLLVRHRYSKHRKTETWVRWLGMAYLFCSVCVAAVYLPASGLLLACFALLAILAFLNTQFYIFLAGKRGVTFMLAAIPFHLLYHFYNGISFIAGLTAYFWRSAERRTKVPDIPPRVRPDTDIGRT